MCRGESMSDPKPINDLVADILDDDLKALHLAALVRAELLLQIQTVRDLKRLAVGGQEPKKTRFKR